MLSRLSNRRCQKLLERRDITCDKFLADPREEEEKVFTRKQHGGIVMPRRKMASDEESY